MEQVVMTSTPGGGEAGAVRPVVQPTDDPGAGSADHTSVPRDAAGVVQADQRGPKPTDLAYTPAERTAIDQANQAFAPIIEAVDAVENIEVWVPPVVMGVRALRDRAIRETGARTHLDQQYRGRFGDLLNAEPIGAWLLDGRRRSLLDAIHYLGNDDTYLGSFMEWWHALTDDQRKKWRNLRTLVDHFKEGQRGSARKRDRRTHYQKEIELVRTEGHKGDTAMAAKVEQARRELATRAVETTETLWTVLDEARPEKVFQSLRDHDAKDYARALYELLGAWLKEPRG